jgi:hypothetical protein
MDIEEGIKRGDGPFRPRVGKARNIPDRRLRQLHAINEDIKGKRIESSIKRRYAADSEKELSELEVKKAAMIEQLKKDGTMVMITPPTFRHPFSCHRERLWASRGQPKPFLNRRWGLKGFPPSPVRP